MAGWSCEEKLLAAPLSGSEKKKTLAYFATNDSKMWNLNKIQGKQSNTANLVNTFLISSASAFTGFCQGGKNDDLMPEAGA